MTVDADRIPTVEEATANILEREAEMAVTRAQTEARLGRQLHERQAAQAQREAAAVAGLLALEPLYAARRELVRSLAPMLGELAALDAAIKARRSEAITPVLQSCGADDNARAILLAELRARAGIASAIDVNVDNDVGLALAVTIAAALAGNMLGVGFVSVGGKAAPINF